MGSVQRRERTEHQRWGTRVWHREAQSVLPLPEGGGAHTGAHGGEGGANFWTGPGWKDSCPWRGQRR